MKSLNIYNYIKITCVLISSIILFYIALKGKIIIVPLILALMISILLTPMCNILEKKLHFNKLLSGLTATLTLLSVILFIAYFIILKLSKLLVEIPLFQQHIIELINNIQEWIYKNFGITQYTQIEYININIKDWIIDLNSIIQKPIQYIVSIYIIIFFTFIYTIFILIYRNQITKFLYYQFKNIPKDKMDSLLKSIKKLIKQYIIGIFIQIFLIFFICMILLNLNNIKYSLIIAIITGILNIIPYIGILISFLIAILITFGVSSTSKIFFIIVCYTIVHFIDANIIIPKLIGSKLKLNPLIIIISMVVGEMIWDIIGIILSIPIIGVLKIICDNINNLKAIGYILGDNDKINLD